MTKEQKIIAGVLAVVALFLITVGVMKNKEPEKTATNTNSTSTVATVGEGRRLILPETGDQEIEIVNGEGTYMVSETATVRGKVTVSDIKVEKGSNEVAVVYQYPGLDSTYAWLVLWDKMIGAYDQKANILLGENMTVDSIDAPVGTDASYTLTIHMHGKGSSVEKILRVQVIANTFANPEFVK